MAFQGGIAIVWTIHGTFYIRIQMGSMGPSTLKAETQW